MGSTVNGSFIVNDTSISSATTTSIANLAITPGIWVLTFNVNVYPNGGVTVTNNTGVRFNISTTLNTLTSVILLIGTEGTNYVNPSYFPTMGGTTVVTVTSNTTYYLNVNVTFSGDIRVSTGAAYFRALRIA